MPKRFFYTLCLTGLCLTGGITFANPNNPANQPQNVNHDNLWSYSADALKNLWQNNNSTQKIDKQTDLVFTSTQNHNDVNEYNKSYIEIHSLNDGLTTPNATPNLATPLATMEFFYTLSAMGDFGNASHALNLNSFNKSDQAHTGKILAQQLDYLLSEKGLYQFNELPDREDGLVEPAMGSSNPIHGIPRRTLKIGTIDYKMRKIPLYLERVKTDNKPPVWVFSQATTENISMLYEQHKPAKFEAFFADWLKYKLFGVAVWELLALVFLFVITLVFGWVFSQLTGFILTSIGKLSNKDRLDRHFIGEFLHEIMLPLTLTLGFGAVYMLVSGNIPAVNAIATSTAPVVWLGFLGLLMWLGIKFINFFANRYEDLQIKHLGDEQAQKAQKRKTYLSIFRRVFIFGMLSYGAWRALGLFVNLEGLGTTLITSAGIVGAVIGIAAQPTLGNIIAGLQVATTQPVRIGDTVMIKGDWCSVEDLRYTYAVLLTWDKRRLIIPMRHFVTQIIENWTHTDTHQSIAIYFYVDYNADIDKIFDTFIDFCQKNDKTDKDSEPEILITDISQKVITLRAVVHSDTPNNAWLLSCDIRKQMIDFLKQHECYLPHDRLIVNTQCTKPNSISN